MNPKRGIPISRLVLAVAAGLVLYSDVCGQRRPRPPQTQAEVRKSSALRRSEKAEDGAVTISYPDTVSLAAFVDYVSQRLGLKILYNDELKSQSVVFRPGEIEVPTANLMDLLRSMLRMQDLALIDADVAGWLRIVQTGDMQRHVKEIRRPGSAPQSSDSNLVVTQVVQLTPDGFAAAVKHARQFLSSPKATVIEVPEKGLLVITDYEAAVAKAIEIIKVLDVAPRSAAVSQVALQHVDAPSIAEQVTRIMTEKAKLEGRTPPSLTIQPNAGGGSLLLVGFESELVEAKELIARFDVSPETQLATIAYSPKHISVARLARLVEAMAGATAEQRAAGKLFADEEVNRLYVTAPAAMHRRVEQILAQEDLQNLEAARPLRVYRPKNRPARDLLSALSEVLPEVELIEEQVATASEDTRPRVPPGPNRPPAEPGPGQAPPMPTAQEAIAEERPAKPKSLKLKGKDFSLSFDEHTNAILAIGRREFHARLEAILPELDRRQPQVVIEMTLVAITFNDSLSLAVELANEEKHNDTQTLLFSAFGLSQINLNTGARRLNPGAGINGIIMGPHETPVLFRAIAAHGNSRIVTTPKVVVSDNTTATIASVEDAPFTSINASDTVATTSFAGYESAGTTLTVTPHIAQGDHLTLDYSFNFSNFTGGGSVGVPPPRTTNTFSGKVVVPDGHTVVIGGLVTDNEADSVTEVPLLGRIPGLGVLFQSSDRARTKTRIYAFIHPVILRDDRFADLKLVSRVERDEAELAETEHPEGEYSWMR